MIVNLIFLNIVWVHVSIIPNKSFHSVFVFKVCWSYWLILHCRQHIVLIDGRIYIIYIYIQTCIFADAFCYIYTIYISAYRLLDQVINYQRRQTSNISRVWVGNKMVDDSNVVTGSLLVLVMVRIKQAPVPMSIFSWKSTRNWDQKTISDNKYRWPHLGPTWILLSPHLANVGPMGLVILDTCLPRKYARRCQQFFQAVLR